MPMHQHLAAVLDHGRVYVAGPMTGLPEWNFPAFNAEAARLRALGYHVENPAENPDPPCKTWEAYMRLALRQMLTCGTVALLPGWATSRGANREVTVARDCGLRVVMAAELVQPVLRDPFASLAAVQGLRAPACWCASCDRITNGVLPIRMNLCPECGDKRCARAEHHSNACTGSPELRAAVARQREGASC